MDSTTLMSLIETAKQDAARTDRGLFFGGSATSACKRFRVELVGVGRPSVGQSSACSCRVDCYIDGSRVKKSVLINAINAINAIDVSHE